MDKMLNSTSHLSFKPQSFDPKFTGRAIKRIERVFICGIREATGYAVFINPAYLSLYYHLGMLDYDFSQHAIINPKITQKPLPQGITYKEACGETLKQIVSKQKGLIVAACHGHTDNMWTNNSIMIVEGKVIKRKVPGIHSKTFIPLDGRFSFFVFDPGKAGIQYLDFEEGELASRLTFKNAISGPVLLENDQEKIDSLINTCSEPGNPRPNNLAEEVLWDPFTNRAAMTAFGSDGEENVILLSLAGDPQKGNEPILSDIIKALKNLGAKNIVLGGLSGDVQQYVLLPEEKDRWLIAQARAGSSMAMMFKGGRPLSSAILVKKELPALATKASSPLPSPCYEHSDPQAAELYDAMVHDDPLRGEK